MLDSGFQSPGFRIPRAKNSWIPESGFRYMGRPKHASSIEIEASFEKVCRRLEQHLSEDLRDLVASTLGFVALNYLSKRS